MRRGTAALTIFTISWMLAACSFNTNVSSQAGDDAGDTSDDDAAIDATVGPPTDAAMPTDADPSCMASDALGFTPSNIDTCILPPSNGIAIVDGTLNIDTNADSDLGEARTQVGGPDVLVAVFDDLTVNGQIIVTGTRPLVIVSLGSISLNGSVVWTPQASQFIDPFLDAGCVGGVGTMGITESAPGGPIGVGGGGGGGGFGAAGGIGAEGRGANGNGDAAGGTTNGTPGISPLRGGCSGGLGAGPSNSTTGGVGGVGGGALQLVAGGMLTINSDAGASVAGQGGRGGTTQSSGGGGGGSGGALLIETGTGIVVNGFLTALGGGGGAGVSTISGPGIDGGDGEFKANQSAPGGQGSGGRGGGGGFGGSPDDEAGDDGATGSAQTDPLGGGGGGGGGVGRIHLRVDSGSVVQNGSAIVAPTPQ